MTHKELIAALIGGAILIVGAIVPLVLGQIKIWRGEQDKRQKEIETEALKAELLRLEIEEKVARQAAHYAKEVGDAAQKHDGRVVKGPERETIATTYVMSKIAGTTEESAKMAVKAAVGELPGIGASSQKGGSNGTES